MLLEFHCASKVKFSVCTMTAVITCSKPFLFMNSPSLNSIRHLHHCRGLQCHDTFKQQNAGLVTVAERLYYFNNMGENGEEERQGRGIGRSGGVNPYTYKIVSWKTIAIKIQKREIFIFYRKMVR